ncbi:spermidine synthase [Plantactinospora sp. WMMB782]|uniref:spermidine synthase n=1 Tax=Plantactinospora sp. WMMB782 TaxID=3404121 RepID=UPI003B9280D2
MSGGSPLLMAESLGDGVSRVWRVDEVLWSGSTAYQQLLIGRTVHGVTLFAEGDRQSSESTQRTYHEALMVPALTLAESVDSVLVVGSSEGVAGQIAVAAGATLVDHVDIDPEAVRLCASHLPYGYSKEQLASAEAGAGVIRLHYADGWDYVHAAVEQGRRYDVIVLDLPDERLVPAPHGRIFGADFLRTCGALLTAGGVVATQAGCPTGWRNESLKKAWIRFRETFGTVVYYGSDEHEWAFLFGRADHVPDPRSAMTRRLDSLPYRASTIDGDALSGNSTAPFSVRHQARRTVDSDTSSVRAGGGA